MNNIQIDVNDLNYELYCFWQSLKIHPNKLIEGIIELKNRFKNGKDLYNFILYRRESNLSILERGIDFFILNRITLKSKLYGKKGILHLNFNHKNLRDYLYKIKSKFLLTYDNCEFIRELYKDFYTLEWNLQYGMNNYKQVKADIGKELFIKYKKL